MLRADGETHRGQSMPNPLALVLCVTSCVRLTDGGKNPAHHCLEGLEYSSPQGRSGCIWYSVGLEASSPSVCPAEGAKAARVSPLDTSGVSAATGLDLARTAPGSHCACTCTRISSACLTDAPCVFTTWRVGCLHATFFKVWFPGLLGDPSGGPSVIQLSRDGMGWVRCGALQT